MLTVKRLLPYCLFLFAALSACSEDDPAQPQVPDVGLPRADLAGNWSGTLSGDFGTAPLSCTLEENGTLTCTIPTGSPYCRIEGSWGVINDQWNALGDDDCEASTVTLAAGADTEAMAGNWLDDSGASGTFELDKL